MPDVFGLVWDVFVSSGMTHDGGFGRTVLPWSEIAALAALHGLTTDEATTLREMSQAYLAGSVIGADVFGIPPWEHVDD